MLSGHFPLGSVDRSDHAIAAAAAAVAASVTATAATHHRLVVCRPSIYSKVYTVF